MVAIIVVYIIGDIVVILYAVLTLKQINTYGFRDWIAGVMAFSVLDFFFFTSIALLIGGHWGMAGLFFLIFLLVGPSLSNDL